MCENFGVFLFYLFADDKAMKRSFFFHSLTLIFFLFSFSLLSAQNSMKILPQDLIIEREGGEKNAENAPSSSEEKGIYLYIRKKEGVESVLLTETAKDKEGKNDSYAYRALEYNLINGDEKRYLDGSLLDSSYARYSLVSSSVINHAKLGECFLIYIPPVLEYGYPWTRHGRIKVGKGTFINIRTFEKKYADYSGAFFDNPFVIDFVFSDSKKSENKKEQNLEKKDSSTDTKSLSLSYNKNACEKFGQISFQTKGVMKYSEGKEKLSSDILEIMDALDSSSPVDLVFAIDTTGSMKDDLEVLNKIWIGELKKKAENFSDLRLGLLFYRDYNDSYNYRRMPVKFYDWTYSTGDFAEHLKEVNIKGNEGGDIPEAVYEALWSAMTFYSWRENCERCIILIGDAEPHEKPRGIKKIGLEEILSLSEEKKISVNCIIVPDDKK